MSLLKKLFKSKPMDWRGFVNYFAERLQSEHRLDTKIHWGSSLDDTSVLILLGEGQDNPCAYLGNHYAHYLQNPEALNEIIALNAKVVREMAEADGTMTVDNILPVIKDTAFLNNLLSQNHDPLPDAETLLLYRPMAGDLLVMYVAHMGNVMRSFGAKDMERLGIPDTDALHSIALANLRRETSGKLRTEHLENSTLTQVITNDDNESALILILDDILANDRQLPANPVFAIPSRDFLALCSPSDHDAVAAMLEIALEVAQNDPYAVSEQLYQYHNGTITLFQSV
ncbi:TPA: DUF1444 domain-containing protein [Neisseria cinerea]|jgi:hypothetical protein